MFIKETTLKKLMKNAYKGSGLMVHNNAGDILIQGTSWILVFYDGNIPKEIKGELIKFVGDLPKKGEAFRITDDGNQMAIDLINDSLFGEPEAEWNITNLMYDGSGGTYRIVENSETKEKKMIADLYIDMVDLSKLDENEPAPDGPYIPEGVPNCMIWNSDTVLYAAYIYDTSGNQKISEFLDLLKNVNCSVAV